MNKPHMVYFEKEDILHLTISEGPEAQSVELSPNIPARPRCARPQPKTPFLSLIVTTATTGGYIDLRRIFVKNLTMFEVSSTVELNDASELIGIEILNASEFLRDTIAESVQAKLLGVPRAESA